MAIENGANNISQLDQNYPTADDFISEGDDHIRLIKKSLKNTFFKIKDICNITHNQLNTLGSALKDTTSEEEVVLYNEFKFKKTGYAESKIAARHSEINQQTLLNLGTMVNLFYPVGSLYISTLNTNPAELFGVGTWVPFGAGRALVGAGTLGQHNVHTGKEFGTDKITLTESNLPAHQHGVTGVTIEQGGEHDHATDFDATIDNGENKGGEHYLRPQGSDGRGHKKVQYRTQRGGAHKHTATGKVDVTGLGQPFDNHQPSIGVHVWKRTS